MSSYAAVRKMMGVCRERLSLRMSVAVSKPSMSGMRMSSRMSANSVFRICLSASFPAPAGTTLRPGPLRRCSIASRLWGSSSTTRMFALDEFDIVAIPLRGQPDSHKRQKLLDVDGFGNVVRGARLDAFLAISFHRLRGNRDDRKTPEFREAANDSNRVVPVELGHHDVHKDRVGIGIILQRLDPVLPVLGVENRHPMLLQGPGQRENVPYVVVDNQHFSPGQLRGSPVKAR